MLFNQIVKKRPEGVTLFLFRQDAGNIARNRICSSGADFPVDSGELMFRQANGDLRRGHTTIIPMASRPNKRPGRRALEMASGEFWGVMGLTLNQNGYAWDFESALKDPAQTTGPASYSDKGVGTCHGPVNGGGNGNNDYR